MRKITVGFVAVLVLVFGFAVVGQGAGEQSFRDKVGPVTVGNVTQTNPLVVPYITWGGDVATFWANGGLTTKKDSIFGKLGLNIQLVPGDDFIQQNRDYVSGKSAFLRPTMHMAGIASEVIATDARTKGVVTFQLTWSTGGDHIVVRKDAIRTVADFRRTKGVLQIAGPHVGLVDDVLKTGGLSWNDVTIVWANDLTGTQSSPAQMFRADPSLDWCCVITPDALGLISDPENPGAEGTVVGARDFLSTAQLSRSIADVYLVRKDFDDAHHDIVTKFAAGYLKAVEEIVAAKKEYDTPGGRGSETFMKVLRLAQSIYGVEVLPTLEVDAYGLIADCTFAGYPGNVAFFKEQGNLNGFEAMQRAALDLATSRGFARVRQGFAPSTLDFSSSAFVGYLANTTVERQERFRAEAVESELESLNSGVLDERTIYSFSINFGVDQEEFSAEQYGVEFQKVVELASKYSNAVIAVRGHADPARTLLMLVRAGEAKGIIKKSGSPPNVQYFFDGRPLDLAATAQIIRLVESGAFDGVAGSNPRETMQAALNLSLRRATNVRDTIVEYAKSHGLVVDRSQIQPLGVGIREPLIPKPLNKADQAQNMRVEFRLVRVEAEAMAESDFGY